MPTLLLTGAGFSRNWGGWLADEAFEYLLGCADLLPHHRTLLWKHRGKGGFESVLQELRDDFVRSPGAHTERPLQEFDKMLLGMFTTMNQGFDDFEPVKNAGLGHQTDVCPKSEPGDWWPIRKSPPLAGLSANIRHVFSECRTGWLE
jgi:hypothetical protein